MRFVIQCVDSARVILADADPPCVPGEIGQGFLVYFGVGPEDTREDVDRFAEKLLKLRVFKDSEGKTNLSLGDIGGEILVVSQFTLYADCRKGNRPSFTHSASPELAEELYDYLVRRLKERGAVTRSGVFGAHMLVESVNHGPFTITGDLKDFVRT